MMGRILMIVFLSFFSFNCRASVQERFERHFGWENFQPYDISDIVWKLDAPERMERMLTSIHVSREFLTTVRVINGEKLSLNDLWLVQEMYKNQVLYNLFKERDVLYQKLDQVDKITIETYPKLREVYPSHTLLDNIPPIQMLKMVLLIESLHEIEHQRFLKALVKRDMDDVESEYGGIFIFRHGKLVPVEYPPDKEIGVIFGTGDHGYAPNFDMFFSDGPVPFHIHPKNRIQGPSAGDFMHSFETHIPWLVIGYNETEKLQIVFYGVHTTDADVLEKHLPIYLFVLTEIE
jgi:hypothetical protein